MQLNKASQDDVTQKCWQLMWLITIFQKPGPYSQKTWSLDASSTVYVVLLWVFYNTCAFLLGNFAWWDLLPGVNAVKQSKSRRHHTEMLAAHVAHYRPVCTEWETSTWGETLSAGQDKGQELQELCSCLFREASEDSWVSDWTWYNLSKN